MIYIDNTTENITIPCRKSKKSGDMSLIMTNGVTNKVYVLEDLVDISVSNMYYYFDGVKDSIGSQNMVVGEYNYSLVLNGVSIEEGLLQFGAYEKTPLRKKYYHRERTIKAYRR